MCTGPVTIGLNLESQRENSLKQNTYNAIKSTPPYRSCQSWSWPRCASGRPQCLCKLRSERGSCNHYLIVATKLNNFILSGRTFHSSERLRKVPLPPTLTLKQTHRGLSVTILATHCEIQSGEDWFEFDHFLIILMIAFIIAIFIPIINQLWRDKFTDNINNQPERVAVDHIDVASLTPGRRIIMIFFI